MILECPDCHARYVVQVALFAQGGRQVRCARCKKEWHAVLPSHIEVFAPLPEAAASPALPPFLSSSPSSPMANVTSGLPTPNLPAVIKRVHWRETFYVFLEKTAFFWGEAKPFCKIGAEIAFQGFIIALKIAIPIAIVLAWPIMDRQQIVRVIPESRGIYESLGFYINHSGGGLIFDQVKSELKYDGGTMRLYVDGLIHNDTPEMQIIPDIKARAIGPDNRIIQSWWVPAPAATVEARSDIPFHTEVNAPMKRTISDVYLEFYNQDEKNGVSQ